MLCHVAALVADANPEGRPPRSDHCRQSPGDALLTLSGGRTVGLLRQRPMLSAAHLRFRLRDDAPTVRAQIAGDLPKAALTACLCVIDMEAVYVGVR
ncbi:MAG: hypothetical protein OXN86_14425 [Chloroflexota bacterium]|nr:hypothetical protein [Chloroflexota bacterium]